jgi:DNA-binding transcriptional regulator LsrR (DeoR family)
MVNLRLLQKKVSKDGKLDSPLDEKFGEVAEVVFKMKLMFELVRNRLCPEAQAFLNEEISKMESLGFGVWGSYIFDAKELKDNIDAFVKFCERHTLAGPA